MILILILVPDTMIITISRSSKIFIFFLLIRRFNPCDIKLVVLFNFVKIILEKKNEVRIVWIKKETVDLRKKIEKKIIDRNFEIEIIVSIYHLN